MGLLDDAIREHLELKRRHGAPSEEVARQEAEALGPPQRAEFAVPAGADADEPPLEPFDPDDRLGADEGLGADDRRGADDHSGADDHPSGEGALDSEDDSRATWEPIVAQPVERSPAVPTPPPIDTASPDLRPVSAEDRTVVEPPSDAFEDRTVVEPPPGPLEDRTVVEPPPAAPASGARRLDPDAPPSAPRDEDVLEETPDFLSETPDHDRLWFEQKPPRDFDFDK